MPEVIVLALSEKKVAACLVRVRIMLYARFVSELYLVVMIEVIVL